MNEDELQNRIQEHQVWLRSAGEKGTRLSLDHRMLSGLSFYNTNLEKSIFTTCDLRECDFSRVNLKHATLKNCDMRHTNFSHAKFDYASLSYSNFFCTNFYDANLRLVDLTDTNLKGAHLFSSRLPENTWLILGEEYSLQITHGIRLRAGCQNHNIEDWRAFTSEEIERMDGERAIKFYPRLLDILDFYMGRGMRPDWARRGRN